MAHDEHEEHGSSHASGSSHGHGGGNHGGGSHEEHEGAPEWLISFADNVMLMMGVFVILLAMNMAKETTGGIGGEDAMGGQKDSEQMLDLVIAIREAFNNPVRIDSSDPAEAALVRRLVERGREGYANEEGISGEHDRTQSIRPTEYAALAAKVGFDEGSVTLTDKAAATIEDFAKTVVGLRMIVEVRGHAGAFESIGERDRAYRLSQERALTVAKALAEAGLSWAQIRTVGCGDSEPLGKVSAAGETGESNSRVEIVVTERALDAAP